MNNASNTIIHQLMESCVPPTQWQLSSCKIHYWDIKTIFTLSTDSKGNGPYLLITIGSTSLSIILLFHNGSPIRHVIVQPLSPIFDTASTCQRMHCIVEVRDIPKMWYLHLGFCTDLIVDQNTIIMVTIRHFDSVEENGEAWVTHNESIVPLLNLFLRKMSVAHQEVQVFLGELFPRP